MQEVKNCALLLWISTMIMQPQNLLCCCKFWREKKKKEGKKRSLLGPQIRLLIIFFQLVHAELSRRSGNAEQLWVAKSGLPQGQIALLFGLWFLKGSKTLRSYFTSSVLNDGAAARSAKAGWKCCQRKPMPHLPYFSYILAKHCLQFTAGIEIVS